MSRGVKSKIRLTMCYDCILGHHGGTCDRRHCVCTCQEPDFTQFCDFVRGSIANTSPKKAWKVIERSLREWNQVSPVAVQ